MKYVIVYYTLSDCTNTVTVEAQDEAGAIENVKAQDDFDRLVSVAEMKGN